MSNQPWKMQVRRAWFRYDGEHFECGLRDWEDVPVVAYEDLPQGSAPAPEPCDD